MDYLIKGDVLPSTDSCVVKSQSMVLSEPLVFTDSFRHCIVESQTGDDEGAITQDVQPDNVEVTPNVIVEPMVADDGVAVASDLGNFLGRKSKLFTGQWVVGSPFSVSFDPWDEFLRDPIIAKKLDNYRFIKGELVITFYVNGTPFHAGMLLASYRYMNLPQEHVVIGGDEQLITRSQRPKIYLNVSTNKSGVLKVPFAFPKNFLKIAPFSSDLTKIGKIHLDSFVNLKMLNAGTDEVTITVFAHMENVKLAAPTHLQTQSGIFTLPIEPQAKKNSTKKDEYSEDGPVSRIASSVAFMSGHLATAFPVIAPFALASQIGAKAVGNIASLFGYSRPVMIDDSMPYKPMPFTSLSLADANDSSLKLSLTSKQEMTVDSTTTGFPEQDLLSIQSFSERESYIDQFDWDVSNPPDDLLCVMAVTPNWSRCTTLVSGDLRVTPTSLGFISRLFESWSGSLRYRFQVVGTQFHKGRLAIGYDSGTAFAGDTYTTNYITIVDLAESRDFTVEIPWQQERPYKLVPPDRTTAGFINKGSTLSGVGGSENGQLYVKVLNELVSPDGLTGVTILVSISAGDNFELANPNGELLRFHSLGDPNAQSAVFTLPIETQAASGELIPDNENSPYRDPNYINIIPDYKSTNILAKPVMFYGEKIMSARQLLKRYSHERTISSANSANGRSWYHLHAMPLEQGFDPAGIDTTLSAKSYNYVSESYISYFKRAFVGWRGSVRWKFMGNSSNLTNMMVYRNSFEAFRTAVVDYAPYSQESLRSSVGEINFEKLNRTGGCQGGTAACVNRTSDCLEVEIPFCSQYRFSATSGTTTASSANVGSQFYPHGDSFTLIVSNGDDSADSNSFDLFVAAGDDFSFVGFTGAPTFYITATGIPSPAA